MFYFELLALCVAAYLLLTVPAIWVITKIHGEELTKEYDPEIVASLLKYGL